MIKALLMVTSINLGNVDTVLPSMKDCMEARDAIIQQDAETKVLCVPYTMEQSKSDDMRDMFSVFMEMIVQLKSYEENYGNMGEEDRQCEPCYAVSYTHLTLPTILLV